MCLMKPEWTEDEAKSYLNFFCSGLNAGSGSTFEIINYLDERYYGLLKLKLKILTDSGNRRLHLLINKERSEFEADCGAYMARHWLGRGSDFNSIDCRCEFKDILTQEYLDKLKDAVDFELSILENEEDD